MSFEIEPGTKFFKNILIKPGNVLRADKIKENADGGAVEVSGIEMKNAVLYFSEKTPADVPVSGRRMLYFESDGNLAMKDPSGVIDKVKVPKNRGELVTHNGTEQVILPGGGDYKVLSVDSSSSTGFSWRNPNEIIEQYETFSLFLELWSSIDKAVEGGRYYSIVNEVEYGPCGIGFTTKSEQEEYQHCVCINCPGENGIELMPRWEPEQELEIRKTSELKNGSYLRRVLTKNKNKSITLSGTDYTLAFPETIGNLVMIIEPDHNTNDAGPCAVFLMTKSEVTDHASIVRISSSPAVSSGEQLEVRWLPNTGVEVRKTGNNYNGVFDVKPLISMVQESGIVTLSGSDFENLYKRKEKVARLIAIKNIVVGGPSAIFSVLKNDKTQQGLIHRLTSCPGSGGEQLELSYDANSKIRIRKTGNGFDGEYNFGIL